MPNEPQIPAALSFDGLGGDARAAIAIAAAGRYSGVAIATNHPQLLPAELSGSARRHFRKILESHQLHLASLRVAVPRSSFADPATIDRTVDHARTAIALAADLGVTTITLNTGPLDGSKVRQDTILAATRELAELATHAGITLALAGAGAGKIHEVLSELRCQMVRANFLPRQSVEAGEDPLTAAGLLAGQIGQL
ncbi:MAG: TIM barrel protein, partial [Phycisphaerae bacterium]